MFKTEQKDNPGVYDVYMGNYSLDVETEDEFNEVVEAAQQDLPALEVFYDNLKLADSLYFGMSFLENKSVNDEVSNDLEEMLSQLLKFIDGARNAMSAIWEEPEDLNVHSTWNRIGTGCK